MKPVTNSDEDRIEELVGKMIIGVGCILSIAGVTFTVAIIALVIMAIIKIVGG